MITMIVCRLINLLSPFTAMTNRRLHICFDSIVTIVFYLVLSSGETLSAQNTFLSERLAIIERGSNQWMCLELESSSPRVFEVSPSKINVSSWPEAPFTGIHPPKEEQFNHFLQVYQPADNARRGAAMKSLCDLYFPLFESKLIARQLPREYAYLPVVLSGMNPHFTDQRGRSGIWGMDYLVARKKGLRIDPLVDERQGGDFTTDAAIDYLAELHTRHNGQPARVILAWCFSPAFVEYQSSSCDSFLSCLNEEAISVLQFYQFTQLYFSSLQTTNRLTNYFDVFSNYETVFFLESTSYSALQGVLGADPNALHAMNPVYTGEQIDGSFRKVPFMMSIAQTALFRQKEDSVYTWKPQLPPRKEVEWVEEQFSHKVRRGETLGGIAGKYHVSISQLKKWNKLRGDRIREGQRLVLFRKVSQIVAPDIKTTESLEVLIENTLEVSPANTPKKEPVSQFIVYKVRSGDSLWSIAKKYPGITPAMIMEWNDCGERITPGQKLKINTQLR